MIISIVLSIVLIKEDEKLGGILNNNEIYEIKQISKEDEERRNLVSDN